MKNMIVTIAILIFALTMTNYHQQCSHLLKTKIYLKEISAEAAFAGLCAWEKEADTGKMVTAVEKIIRLNLQEKMERVKWHIKCSEIKPGRYSVAVTLQLEHLSVSSSKVSTG